MRVWMLSLGMSVLAAPALATTQVYLTELEHAALSDAVVRATVADQETSRDPNTGRIFTHTTLSVTHTLMGTPPAELTVHQMGGQLGEQALFIAGDARLKQGEDVVLFLNEEGGNWFLTALGQSMYSVVPSLDGVILERELGDGIFKRDAAGNLDKYTPIDDGQPMTLTRLAWMLSDGGYAPAPTEVAR